MIRVMEQNFAYNLKLEDFALLCHMSLSNFKKCFSRYYNTKILRTSLEYIKLNMASLHFNTGKNSQLLPGFNFETFQPIY